jgi:hypothetical protein
MVAALVCSTPSRSLSLPVSRYPYLFSTQVYHPFSLSLRMCEQTHLYNSNNLYNIDLDAYLLFVHQVDVRMREGNLVNVYMLCRRKPDIMLSTMRALDNLDLDIEQAVMSCFDTFAMDIFRAKVCGDHIMIISSSIIFNQILTLYPRTWTWTCSELIKAIWPCWCTLLVFRISYFSKSGNRD